MLIVGTVAFDSIETPHGSVDHVLGGSASFSSIAASFFTRPRIVGVVGNDFPDEFRQVFHQHSVDLTGLQTNVNGKTFYWKGKYHENLNHRDTMEVHLNVLNHFDPIVPEKFRNTTHLFLANIGPEVQAQVLDQMTGPELVLADTMDFWIQTKHDELMRLLPRVDGLLLNDSEARLLSGKDNLVQAAKEIRRMGPTFVVVKKGEHGAMLCSSDGIFVIPAYPVEHVVDPTGAGDSFAGGLVGSLLLEPGHAMGRLRRAMAYGTILASLTVEGFGLDRLRRTNLDEIHERLEWYRTMLNF